MLSCCWYCASALGQTNIWTSTASGYWEDPHWSMGVLPGTNQTILFTNAWQALAIGSSTVQNHPETLNVNSVTVAAPTNSFSELLLNYAGLQTPLFIGTNSSYSGSLVVGSNSAVVMLSSALQINNALEIFGSELGAFSIGGTFNQGDFSTVTAGFMHLGDIGPGIYNLTNGLVTIGVEYVGSNYPSIFNQFGGTNSTSLQMISGGEYYLYDGYFGGNVTCRGGGFNQLGGIVSGGVHLKIGSYTLAGGILSTAGLTIPEAPGPFEFPAAYGTFLQTGGTNLSGGLYMQGTHGPPYTASGSYTLSGGTLLVSGRVNLGGLCGFNQQGGVHTNSGIGLSGSTSRHGEESANYSLGGGALSTLSIGITEGTFSQSGGTNLVTGAITVSGGGGYAGGGPSYPVSVYNLTGGYLSDSTVTVQWAITGGFFQSGGIHIISNLLHILIPADNFYGYVLSGGQLVAQNIMIEGGTPFHHQGGTLTVPGTLTLNGGIWDEHTSGQSFGPLQLGSAGTSAMILLPTNACVLHFANSSSQNWSNQASLVIENWKGSVADGSLHQVTFGNGASALTSQQLSQILFHNPAGTGGMYPAMILASGEIVPSRWLSSQLSGSGLILQWPSGSTLQSATNVSGPYEDVLGATSPRTNQFNERQRFFRLRQ